MSPTGGQNAWRQPLTGADWMREVEKRILHEERRPGIRVASDILGPGIAAFSILVADWNAPETAFNGFFHSEPGVLNSPLSSRFWMGTSQGTPDGFGLQRVTEYRGGSTDITWPHHTYLRKFYGGSADTQRQFSSWRMEDNTQPGIMSEFALTGLAPNSWLPCDGSVVNINDYPDLYRVIGGTFNTGGEPTDQFRLPNVSGRVIKT